LKTSNAPSEGTAPITPELLAQRFSEPVRGPAYRIGARILTAGVVLGLFAYGAQVLTSQSTGIDPRVALLMAAAAAVVLVQAAAILFGRTTIDRQGLRQDGLFAREFRWHEISQARCVRMPLAYRLVLTTPRGPIKAIDSGCAALDEAFGQIEQFYRAPPTLAQDDLVRDDRVGADPVAGQPVENPVQMQAAHDDTRHR